ncbi:MAG: hypothetical protein DWQ02_16590 [Bacteroidetes bacterium]|nr:MAG: hypothetical protein DWQ02_16590 [Bacteroidota bacterium]
MEEQNNWDKLIEERFKNSPKKIGFVEEKEGSTSEGKSQTRIRVKFSLFGGEIQVEGFNKDESIEILKHVPSFRMIFGWGVMLVIGLLAYKFLDLGQVFELIKNLFS